MSARAHENGRYKAFLPPYKWAGMALLYPKYVRRVFIVPPPCLLEGGGRYYLLRNANGEIRFAAFDVVPCNLLPHDRLKVFDAHSGHLSHGRAIEAIHANDAGHELKDGGQREMRCIRDGIADYCVIDVRVRGIFPE